MPDRTREGVYTEREVVLRGGVKVTITVTASPTEEASRTRDSLVAGFADDLSQAGTLIDAAKVRNIDVDELFELLTASLSAPPSDSSLLTENEVASLESIGVTIPTATEAVRLASAQMVELAAAYTNVAANSFSVADFARIAGVGASRVRQRLNFDRTLWGFKVGPRHQWRIPAWAVTANGALPGVEIVSQSIPENMHPVAVERLVTVPNPDLVIDDEPVSVVDWLRSGRDPATAAAAVGQPSDLV